VLFVAPVIPFEHQRNGVSLVFGSLPLFMLGFVVLLTRLDFVISLIMAAVFFVSAIPAFLALLVVWVPHFLVVTLFILLGLIEYGARWLLKPCCGPPPEFMNIFFFGASAWALEAFGAVVDSSTSEALFRPAKRMQSLMYSRAKPVQRLARALRRFAIVGVYPFLGGGLAVFLVLLYAHFEEHDIGLTEFARDLFLTSALLEISVATWQAIVSSILSKTSPGICGCGEQAEPEKQEWDFIEPFNDSNTSSDPSRDREKPKSSAEEPLLDSSAQSSLH